MSYDVFCGWAGVGCKLDLIGRGAMVVSLDWVVMLM